MGTRLDMVGIFVNDIGRMVAFYRDVLMFEVDWDGESPYAEFKNEGVRFSMYRRAILRELLGQEPTYPSGLNGTLELAIDMPALRGCGSDLQTIGPVGRTPDLRAQG